jgi:Family of unknown function (DUF6402)
MFPVELCPEVMRHFGLVQGRRLMETWFSRNPAHAPFYSAPPVAISIDWVLRFARAKDVYEQLMKDSIWINEPAQIEIGRVLQRNGFLGSSPAKFGDLWRPVADLDDDYINQRPVTGYEGIDDLAAALGAFDFRVVVGGSVDPVNIIDGRTGNVIGRRHDVTIEDVGVYIRDSYDFEGDQFLGWWTYPDHYEYWVDDDVDTGRGKVRYPYGYVLGMPFQGGELLTNEEFKKFRKKRNKGGDFLVYSDLKRHKVWAKFNTGYLLEKYGDGVFAPTIHDIVKQTVKKGGATIS